MCRPLACVLTGFLLLLGPGCEVYEYSFRTVVSPAGEVSREVTFEAKETGRTEAIDGQKDVEKAPERPKFTGQLILPDRERFDGYELERGHLVGSWHSSGVIHSDFRFALPGSDRDSSPTAHNEGEVFVREYGLVRSINYVETFHDFRERWEWERNADALIEEVAKLALEVLEEDFGSERDFEPLKDYVHNAVVPFLKSYKTLLCQYHFTGQQPWRANGLSQTPPAPWELAMSHDLMKLGLAEDLKGLDELAVRPAAVKKAQELLAGRGEAGAELRDRLHDYFLESRRFEANLQKKIAEQYGSMESFTNRVISRCYSFSLNSHMFFQEHGFTVFVSVPGVVSHVSPEPESVEDDNGRTDIEWVFSEWAFFPDGVHLIAISFEPIEGKQKQVFGAVVLDEAEKMADSAELFRRLNSQQRDVIDRTFEACTKQGSTGPLTELASVAEEQADRLHEQDPFSEEMRGADNLRNLLRFLTELADAGQQSEDN